MRIDKEFVQSVLMNPKGLFPSEEYIKMRLDNFVDQIETQVHTQLMKEMMVKYSEIARQFEEKNQLLVKSEAGLLEAQKIAVLGRWDLDIPTQAVQWSEMMYQILELESWQRPKVDLFTKMIHPDDRDMVTRASLHFSNAEYSEQRYRLLMPDGRIKWVNVRRTATFDSAGKIIRSHGTIQDITDMKLIEEKLQKYNHHLEDLVNEKVQEISESQMATIFALVKLSESRDDDTGAHIERTASTCRFMAERLRMLPRYADLIDDAYVVNIYHASPLHDIGKVGIPDAILLKPGKLTPQEFAIMKTHTTIGFNTLSQVKKQYTQNSFLTIGIEIAKCHHEKWDGTGYPQGLSGEEIPLSARIMALVDVYDALRSKRVYKDAFSHEKSCAIIEEGSGTHFDPMLIKIFIENNQVFRAIHDRQIQAQFEAIPEPKLL